MSRRDALANSRPGPSTHAGLWLDRFVDSLDRKEASVKSAHVADVCSLVPGDDYAAFHERWKIALEAAGAKHRTARVKGRLAIGLGADGVLETSISLHRTWGVPVIPGSGLKGAAAAFARMQLDPDEWGEESDAYRSVFGTQKQAGAVRFFDALWVPGTGHAGRPLHPDVMTVHHRDYYSGKDVPPADWDSPVPVSFVTATGSFLVALAGPDDAVATAFDILELVLEHAGVGAKTSSGYGRMTLELSPRDPSEMEAEDLVSEIQATFARRKHNQEMDPKFKKWRTLPLAIQKRVGLSVLECVKSLPKDDRKAARSKVWFKEMTAGLEETS